MIVSEEKRTQLFSYLVHAGEILKKSKQIPKRSYKYIFLPSGIELYTSIIKSAGHLFLDRNVSHRIVITEQNTNPQDIITYSEDLLLRGREIKNKSILPKKTQKIPNEIKEQLLYCRLLNKISEVNLWGVGNNIAFPKIMEKIKTTFTKKTGIIIIGSLPETDNSNEHKKIIDHILNKKAYHKHWLGNIFCEISKDNKTDPEVVMYVDTSELKRKSTNGTGYLCVVA